MLCVPADQYRPVCDSNDRYRSGSGSSLTAEESFMIASNDLVNSPREKYDGKFCEIFEQSMRYILFTP